MMGKKWYEKALHRNVVDMHITDHCQCFLKEFNTENYIHMLKKSKAHSAIVYAVSHVGICYYPSVVGEMHKNLDNKDILKELIEGCHKEGIAVVVYYSVIHNSWAYDHYPEWRIIESNGKEASENSRYGYCCPNSGYKDFVVEQIKELCSQYDFEGMRFDMTFWPRVCYCPSCQQRYAKEVGGSIPKIVNWTDKRWVAFQRKREEWLNEFAKLCTDTVKRYKPNASVEHQASTIHNSWACGVNADLTFQNDFLQGDFYGDALQGSFACKLFYNLTLYQPFGFETSSSIQLWDHTTLKSEELLLAKVCAAIANGGAFVFIDAIDPKGTLNPKVYERMNKVFHQTAAYEEFLGGELVQDVGIYLSTESKFDFEDNGKTVQEASQNIPHIDSAVNVASALIKNHIPFGVITRKNIHKLLSYKMIILPNILMMSEEEAEQIRQYVKNGGHLYASKYTSLYTPDGKHQGNFMLSDVLGVDFIGMNYDRISYIGPIDSDDRRILKDYDLQYPVSVYDGQMMVKRRDNAISYGKVVLPYTNPEDPWNYASIHSNPPGYITDKDGIVLHYYGKGKTVYVSGDIERKEVHQNEFMDILGLLYQEDFSFRSNAPHCVELTLFQQYDKNRLILNVLNFQKDLPNIPVRDIEVEVKVENNHVDKIEVIPSHTQIEFTRKDSYVHFTLPEVDTFMMVVVYLK